jgi:hypothetical protein
MGLWYNAKSKFLSWASDIRVYPGGFILFGKSYYKIDGLDSRAILDALKPGDVMLRRYTHYLGSLMIPGHFSHAAIYVGDNKVIHMLGEGITEEDILTFLRCDDIAILRTNLEVSNKAIDTAKDLLAKKIPYDYDFSTNVDRLYCTELIDNIFDKPVSSKNNGKIVMPDDFMKYGVFDIVWQKNLAK